MQCHCAGLAVSSLIWESHYSLYLGSWSSFHLSFKVLEAYSNYTSSQLTLLSFEGLYSIPFFFLAFKFHMGKNTYCFVSKNINSAKTWTVASFVHNADTVSYENQSDFVSELIWTGAMKSLPALDTSQGSTAAVFMQLLGLLQLLSSSFLSHLKNIGSKTFYLIVFCNYAISLMIKWF